MTEPEGNSEAMAQSMPQNVTLLKRVVIGLGIVLVVGWGVVAVTMINRLKAAPGPVAGTDVAVILPPGAEILETRVDGGRLLVRLRRDGLEEIRLFDATTGAATGLIRIKPGPP